MPKKKLDELVKKYGLKGKDKEKAKKEYKKALELYDLDEKEHLNDMLNNTAKFDFKVAEDFFKEHFPDEYQSTAAGATIDLGKNQYILIDDKKYKRGDFLHEGIHYLHSKKPKKVKDIPHAHAFSLMHRLHEEPKNKQTKELLVSHDMMGFQKGSFKKYAAELKKQGIPVKEWEDHLITSTGLAVAEAYKKGKNKKERYKLLKELLKEVS